MNGHQCIVSKVVRLVRDGKCTLTTRVVASCQQDTTSCLLYPDDMAGGRCAENAILADYELLDAVCSTNLSNQLCDFWVPVAAITTNDEGRSSNAFWD